MDIHGGAVRFGVKHGYSSSWSLFGGTKVDEPTNLENLNGYSRTVSANNSVVTYGDNRVSSLIMTKVRCYDKDDNLVCEDNSPLVVFEDAGEDEE